jgi:hypothetical protein
LRDENVRGMESMVARAQTDLAEGEVRISDVSFSDDA